MSKNFLLLILSFLLFILLVEVGLRAAGFLPYEVPEFNFESQPTNCFGKDSFGLVLIPGQFDVNIGNGLKHQVTHGSDFCRITSGTTDIDSSKPAIEIYGCSYSYGQGVDDEETYPFLIQSRFPQFKVINRSVPGYGVHQAYYRIKEAFENGDRPEYIIFNYAYFHEERNVLAKSYQYRLYEGFQAMQAQKKQLLNWESMVYPYVELNADSFSLNFLNVLSHFHHLPLVEYSSIMNRMDLYLAFRNGQNEQDLPSSKVLIENMAELCQMNEVTFILAEIDQYEIKHKIADFENLTISNEFQELTGIAKIEGWDDYVFPIDFFELHCIKPEFDLSNGLDKYFLQNLMYVKVHGKKEEEL